jgi:hyperosmotically inducible periplasmic protein
VTKSRTTSFASIVALAGLLAGSAQLNAWQEPDNTKVNKSAKPTADQAKENTNDRETMQKIRKAIMADKSLSTYAHNVKVISQHGKVTLKGPVRTEAEKVSIEAKAVEVAGAANVVNQLEVKPSKP